nr:AAA family ATPase [uncultured Desulfobacter sp.]
MDLIKRLKKPVAMFIDEAHNLRHKTLVGLKRIQEVVQEAESLLSIILIGHPRLSIDFGRPSMEDIGGRGAAFQMNGIQGFEKEYIDWLLSQCISLEGC